MLVPRRYLCAEVSELVETYGLTTFLWALGRTCLAHPRRNVAHFLSLLIAGTGLEEANGVGMGVKSARITLPGLGRSVAPCGLESVTDAADEPARLVVPVRPKAWRWGRLGRSRLVAPRLDHGAAAGVASGALMNYYCPKRTFHILLDIL